MVTQIHLRPVSRFDRLQYRPNLGYTPISRGFSCASGSVKIYKTVPPRFTTFITSLSSTTTTIHSYPKVGSEPMLQGRRVRVLDPITNAVHSPAEPSPHSSPRTPSPTLSESTASSLATPPTPQSLFLTMPLPASKPQIHPAITYTGIPPYLCFDLAFPPSYLLVPDSPSIGSDRSSASSHSFENVNLSLLSEQATYPASPSITLITEALPWSITVTAKSAFVTVYDVLQALHSSLRLQVTKTEWASLSRASQDVIAASFHKRAGGFANRLKREKQLGKGVRRLDFLVGRTRLFGISPFGKQPDVFKVHWEVGRVSR